MGSHTIRFCKRKSGVQGVMVALQMLTVRLKAFMEHAIKIQLARFVSWFSDTKRVSSDIWSPLDRGWVVTNVLAPK